MKGQSQRCNQSLQLTGEQMNQMRDGLKNSCAGSANAGKLMILQGGLD
jgi:hypothetical protein